MFEHQHFSHMPTGIPSLDESHRSLQFLLDRLFHPQVMCGDQGGQCSRIRDTIRFLSRNLAHEERLMRAAGYPAATAHEREHRKLLRRMARMERSMSCSDYDNQRISGFLTAWMNHHVAVFDKPFGAFLRAQTWRPGRQDEIDPKGR